MDKLIGQQVSHYDIIEKLGGGGMGIVYKARDIKLGRTVALKFLPPELSRDEGENVRFIREARAASSVDHKNICTVHEISETEDGQIFIAMSCYDGETVKTSIQQGSLGIEDAVDIAIQSCEGLARAHEEGIVHRDVKPANIMVTSRKEVKVLDFGLAKISGSTKLTQMGATVGTIAYMSPEQVRGREVDRHTDIWSIGVVLYEMVTGQQAFGGENAQVVLRSIIEEQPRPPSELCASIPAKLEAVIAKCVQKDMGGRYQSMDEVSADLREVQAELQTGAATTGSSGSWPRQTGRIRGLVAWFAVGLLILAALIFFVFTRPGSSTLRVSVAVLDFVNETDRPELDGLSGMLITSLEQSHRLSVMTRSRMFDILRQMGKSDVSSIDESLGREICRRAKVAAMVIASVRRFDDLYTIDVKVVEPSGDAYLFAANEKGTGLSSIPSMIDAVAEKMRIELREEEEAVRSTHQGGAAITTQNLEAYRHYFKGEEFINKMNMKEAKVEFEKAVALDSTFGLAYYRLAYVVAWDHDTIQSDFLKKAVLFIDRIPEKERYLVRAHQARLEEGYFEGILILKEMEDLYPNDKELIFNLGDWMLHSGQDSLAVDYFKRVLELDPHFERALNHLIMAYVSLGQFDFMYALAQKYMPVNPKQCLSAMGEYKEFQAEHDSAAFYFEKALEIDSTFWDPLWGLNTLYQYTGQTRKRLNAALRYARNVIGTQSYRFLAAAYTELGEFDAALATLEEVRAHLPAHAWPLFRISLVYMNQERYDEAEVLLNSAVAMLKPGDPKLGYFGLWMLNIYRGKYQEAMTMLEKVVELDPHLGRTLREEIRSDILAASAGNKEQIHSAPAKKILEYESRVAQAEPIWKWLLRPNLTYFAVLAGAHETADRMTEDTRLPWLRSAMYSDQSMCSEADSVSQIALQQSPAYAKIVLLYHLARCRYNAGEVEETVKLLHDLHEVYDYSQEPFRAMYYPKSFYLLGKCYEQNGDLDLAVKNFQKFLEIWKDADDDLPEFIDAKDRLIRLKN